MPKNPPWDFMFMSLFAVLPSRKPVYMPHAACAFPIFVCSLVNPPVYRLCFEFRWGISSNFVSLPICCQFNHALLMVWRALIVSPPLRPSSLYSPYMAIVPYMGACPYVVDEGALIGCLLCVGSSNAVTTVWPIVCWIDAMLCADIAFVYMCEADAFQVIKLSVTVKEVFDMCFMTCPLVFLCL